MQAFAKFGYWNVGLSEQRFIFFLKSYFPSYSQSFNP